MAEEISGLAGGNGGQEIRGFVVPAGAKISAVYVLTGLYVDAMEIAYQGEGSAEVRLGPIGGFGGISHVFELGEGEYLTGISGRDGIYIDSIRFHTNLRTSDTFGGPFGAADFALHAPEGTQIVGFVGRAGWFIDALGIVTRPLPTAPKARRTRAAKAEEVTTTQKAPKAAKAPKVEATSTAETALPVEKPRRRKKAEAGAAAETAPKAEKAPKTKKAPKAESAVTAETALPVEKAPKRKKSEAGAAVETAPKARKAPGRKKAAQKAEPLPEVPAAVPAEVPAAATRGGALQLPEPVEREPKPIDLQKVEGIGPKIAEMLIANGIYDLSDLAATPVEQIREILDAAGPRYRIANPGTWPEQAALGAAGDWEAFDALTAQLKRGRRV